VKKLRLAVIGAGHLGRIHARLLRSLEQVDLVGVVDPAAEARQAAADELQVPVFAHHGEVARAIDAAIVAATTDQHHEISRDLLCQNVHLLVEKPITASLAEADDLVDLARSKGCVLQVGHVERFNPAWCEVAPFARRPRYIEAVRTSGYTFRSTDVGVVLDLMIHDLDLALFLVRSQVVDVDAVGATIFGPHEDMAHAHLRFANGCVVNLNASRTSFLAQRTMQIFTDRAYVGIDFAAAHARLIRPGADLLRGQIDVHGLARSEKDRVRESLFTDLLPLEEISVEKRNAILDEQREFVDCVFSGRSPRVTGEQARDCVAVAEKIQASIAAKNRKSRLHARHAPDLPPPAAPPHWQHPASRRKAG